MAANVYTKEQQIVLLVGAIAIANAHTLLLPES